MYIICSIFKFIPCFHNGAGKKRVIFYGVWQQGNFNIFTRIQISCTLEVEVNGHIFECMNFVLVSKLTITKRWVILKLTIIYLNLKIIKHTYPNNIPNWIKYTIIELCKWGLRNISENCWMLSFNLESDLLLPSISFWSSITLDTVLVGFCCISFMSSLI